VKLMQPELVVIALFTAGTAFIVALTWAQKHNTHYSDWHRCKCGKWCRGKREYRRWKHYSKRKQSSSPATASA
jgi:hypothetical protein